MIKPRRTLRAQAADCTQCPLQRQCWPEGTPETMNVMRETLSAGGQLWHQGESCAELFMVRSGAVKLVSTLPDGEQQLQAFALPGELIGVEALAGIARQGSATVLGETSVCRLRWVTTEEPQLAAPALLRRAARVLLASVGAVQRHADPRQALLRFLRSLAERTGVPDSARGPGWLRIQLPMGRADIGQHLGFAEETICRALRRLARDGTLLVRGRTVWLPALQPAAD